ncbi:phospholipase D family protein [Nonomuraea ceibae]|uniref:phospholipase D family protein n=1 Tax=Nonomuraea ceibae TaxID=1935170 RepID=UPI001C5DEFD7|nr:phospholipase D family protein [Nonomuraea ceibae]
MNQRLHQAMAVARLQAVDVAARLAVDPKTVERWIRGRVPYPRHRWAVADLLRVDEADLWPDVEGGRRPLCGEIRAVYRHRHEVPRVVWHELFGSAQEEIGILTYSGLFLAEDPAVMRTIGERARAGVRVRILLGDSASAEVAARGIDECIGPEVMAARTKNALALFRPLVEVPGVELRVHRTVLYNSIYRADRQLMVNTHAYAVPAAKAPVTHFRIQEPEGAAAVYASSFERVWTGAEPVTG